MERHGALKETRGAAQEWAAGGAQLNSFVVTAPPAARRRSSRSFTRTRWWSPRGRRSFCTAGRGGDRLHAVVGRAGDPRGGRRRRRNRILPPADRGHGRHLVHPVGERPRHQRRRRHHLRLERRRRRDRDRRQRRGLQ